MRVVKFLIVAILAAASTGCALTDATLAVAHDPELVQNGPLSEVDSLQLTIGEFTDNRDDQERIGYKKNGFNQNTADITTETAVTSIVADAVAHAFTTNGHATGYGPLVVSGAVNRFWLDTDPNFWSIEVIGTVEAYVEVSARASGDTIYRQTYSGSYKDNRQAVTNAAYDEVISGAVSSLIDEIVFDEDLADALADFGE